MSWRFVHIWALTKAGHPLPRPSAMSDFSRTNEVTFFFIKDIWSAAQASEVSYNAKNLRTHIRERLHFLVICSSRCCGPRGPFEH